MPLTVVEDQPGYAQGKKYTDGNGNEYRRGLGTKPDILVIVIVEFHANWLQREIQVGSIVANETEK